MASAEVIDRPTQQIVMLPAWKGNYVLSEPGKYSPGYTREEVDGIIDFSGDKRSGTETEQARYYSQRLVEAARVGIVQDGLYAGHKRGEAEALIGMRRRLIYSMHSGLVSGALRILEREQIAARRQMRVWNRLKAASLKQACGR